MLVVVVVVVHEEDGCTVFQLLAARDRRTVDVDVVGKREREEKRR